MILFDKLVNEIGKGSSVLIRLKEKDLIVNGQYWIQNGKVNEPCDTLMKHYANIMELIEDMYISYKYSYPDEMGTKRKRSYFKALTADEMTDAELVTGAKRRTARVLLEATVLLSTLNGDLKWRDEWGSWFYQGKKDKDFILLKEWVV